MIFYFLPKLGRLVKFIKGYPHPSNVKTWETGKACAGFRDKLLPHYFSPSGDKLNHEKIMTELISGIDNSMEWRKDMGLEIEIETKETKFQTRQTFVIHPPSRYEELFKTTEKNGEFWDFLASCNNTYEMKASFKILYLPYSELVH